ncbi:hypothetical protein [Myxococcus sp. RHSTA-1-4]|uniref:hypothetical protein n=1 Tax=Myxococcus sp. RHSTA-1-4 TaxID=2874601 RepID=UPI001CBB5563|nr:hypothetical protein [Myxococcus sp. RHSTA-1-4]MBZ4417858.1 hypothetical protein [Myxococcus sp. RHSTA-1-4]
MTDPSRFQEFAEAEMRKARVQGNIGALSSLIRALPADLRQAYAPIIGIFGHQPELQADDSISAVGESARVGACRLALMGMHFDEEVPRWSSFMVGRLVDAVLSIPQAGVGDLFRAMWQMLSARGNHLSRETARFIREIIRDVLSRDPKKREVDLHWLISQPSTMTEPQAYFIYNALALAPALFTQEVEEMISAALRGGEFFDEFSGG